MLRIYLPSSPDLPTVVTGFTYRRLRIFLPSSLDLPTSVLDLPTIVPDLPTVVSDLPTIISYLPTVVSYLPTLVTDLGLICFGSNYTCRFASKFCCCTGKIFMLCHWQNRHQTAKLKQQNMTLNKI